jgi:hypothetical protein
MGLSVDEDGPLDGHFVPRRYLRLPPQTTTRQYAHREDLKRLLLVIDQAKDSQVHYTKPAREYIKIKIIIHLGWLETLIRHIHSPSLDSCYIYICPLTNKRASYLAFVIIHPQHVVAPSYSPKNAVLSAADMITQAGLPKEAPVPFTR